MMEYWKLTRLKFTKKRLVIVYLLSISLFSLSTVFSTVKRQYPSESMSPFTARGNFYFQDLKNSMRRWNAEESHEGGVEPRLTGTRKLLGGPGSSPPRCISKCGRCTPCQPVHIPVPPGTPVTAEYYPEAWRCKCGNKLYMP